MTKNSGLASSQTLILGAAGIIVAALLGAYGLGFFDSEDPIVAPQQTATEPVQERNTADEPDAGAGDTGQAEAVAESGAEQETAPAGETADTAEATPEEAPVPEAVDSPAPPAFDVVRVEPDGNTLVAGIAADGEQVDILLDRVAIASAEPGPDGKFATFVTLDPSDAPRLMSLLLHAGEARIASQDQVIIAPVKPVVVAEAEPQAEDTATQVATADPAPAETPGTKDEAAQAAPADEAAEQPVETAMEQTTTEAAPDPAATSSGEAVATAEETASNGTAAAVEQVAVADSAQTAPADEQETAAPAVLLAGKDGVRVIQPAQTGTAPAELVLDAISYGDGGAVELAGRGGAGGALIRAYLNNTARASVEIGETGQWKTRLTDVAPGIYTLRIDQIDAAGKVTSRIETPFKREAPEKIAAAEAAQAQTGGTQQAGASAPIRVVTIQPGNTLWAIAREQYGEGLLYVRLFEANRDLIRDPDLIYPGQVFEIPRD